MGLIKTVKEKLHNIHVLSLMTNGSVAVIGMVTYALLCHTLSLAERGVWLMFQSTFLLTDSLRAGFLSTGFIKFYAGTSVSQARGIAGSAWVIAIVITLLFCLLSIPGFFFSYLIKDPGLVFFVKWFGVLSLVSLPYFMASCIVQAEGRFDRFLKLRLVNLISFMAGVILLIVFHERSVLSVVYAFFAAFVISSIFALSSGWSKIGTLGKQNRPDILKLYHFGKYTVGTAISSNFFLTIDNFIVNFMLGPAALAVFDIGVKLLEIIEIPMRSFAASTMPILSAAFNRGQKDDLMLTMKKLVGMLTIVMIPIVILVIIFAEIPIGLLGGGKYLNTEAVNLFRLFILFALLTPADRFFALTLDAVHRPGVNFYKVLGMLALTLIFDYIGISLFGNIYGIAYAYLVPLIFGIVVSYFALQQYAKFGFWSIYGFGYQETKAVIAAALAKFRKA